MKVFVVDGGFGFFKYLVLDGKCKVENVPENPKGKIRSCYKRTGEGWKVGESALLETGSGYVRTVDELIEMHPIFVEHCQKAAGVSEVDVLVVGLPLGAYEEKAELLQKKLKNTVLQKNANAKIFVFPQGLGGIKYFLSRHPVKKGNVFGIDVGFNTVITTLYDVENKQILTGKTYYRKGISDLVTSLLLPRIRKFVGDKTLTPQELNYLTEHKKLQIGFEIIDISYEVEESTKEYVDDLINFIANDLKSNFGVITFEHLVFFGGGANWLKGKLVSEKVNVVILEEPEFANAYGFAVKALELLSKAQPKQKQEQT